MLHAAAPRPDPGFSEKCACFFLVNVLAVRAEEKEYSRRTRCFAELSPVRQKSREKEKLGSFANGATADPSGVPAARAGRVLRSQ
jgi:hypothetical protein